MDDIDQCYNDALKIVLEAGEILLKGFKSPKEISTKTSDRDFVTQFDKLVEKTLIDGIHKLYPNHKFIAEESASDNILTNEPTWIIDPIDGTTNFIQGFPFCCISLALVVESDILIGIVYNPIINQLFTAQKGKGAYLNNEKIHVSNTEDFVKAMSGYVHSEKREKIIDICRGVRYLGSAALELCYIAMGAIDFCNYQDFLKCWDVAAGILLIREAGGFVLDLKGDNFKDIMHVRLIAACTKKLAENYLNLENDNK